MYVREKIAYFSARFKELQHALLEIISTNLKKMSAMKTRKQDKQLRKILKGEKIVTKMPEGWRFCYGAVPPMGYRWINNGKPLFSGQYEHALLKIASC